MFDTITNLIPTYNWKLALIAFFPIAILPHIFAPLSRIVPTFKREHQRDNSEYMRKMQNPKYVRDQKYYGLQGLVFWLTTFFLTVPYCVTINSQPWWRVITDSFIILMIYDFFYYLAHRFLFHDNTFFEGLLKQAHALHHRVHNPVANDVYYTHWVEIGLAQSFVALGTFTVYYFFGGIHVVTFIVTWILHQEIQKHNHAWWNESKFPFKYMKYISDMHHTHHIRFNSGNFGSMSMFFDWLFGTLDRGSHKH